MAAGFQNPFAGFQNPFQDFDLGRAFMGAPRPQPQDFMVPGPVTTPGVSVNPHAGFDFKPVYTPEGQPAGIVPYSAPVALGQSDAPTYQQRSEMLDATKYSKELERWKLIENERLKRMSSLQEMLAYMGKQSGGGRASGGGGGGSAPKSGRPTNLKMTSMGVANKPGDPFRKLEEFYPFLGRYRNT